jgi:hypothetical protein
MQNYDQVRQQIDRNREAYRLRQRLSENTQRLQANEAERRELLAMVASDHHRLAELEWERQQDHASDPVPATSPGQSGKPKPQASQPPAHQPPTPSDSRSLENNSETGSGVKWWTRSFWTSFEERRRPTSGTRPGREDHPKEAIQIAILENSKPGRPTIDVIKPDGSRTGPIGIRQSWFNIAEVIVKHGPIVAEEIGRRFPHARLDYLTDMCGFHKDTIALVFDRPGRGKHPDFEYRIKDPRLTADRASS